MLSLDSRIGKANRMTDYLQVIPQFWPYLIPVMFIGVTLYICYLTWRSARNGNGL